ncbi:MAG TPA: Yip1 family protein [Roseiflexaceae bacterium]|nr:Yip1 family protein [Roseiflexaceae bacterium]
MFQQMLNGSRAVLLRPSVSTFEEYERNDLGWALIYIAIAAVATAILNAVRFAIGGPAMQEAMRSMQDQFGGQPLPPGFGAMMGGGSLTGAIVGGLFGSIIGFLIWTGIIFLLGRAFGGSGAFGELAYDVALFSAPMAVINALVGVISIGPLACLTFIVTVALALYNLYLSWLSIQSGMNLPPNKALIVILLPFLAGLLLCCGLAALLVPWFTVSEVR